MSYDVDKQEAESHKYSQNIVMVLPLKSGAYALFNHKREFLRLVEADHYISVVVGPWRNLPEPDHTLFLTDLLKDLDL